MSLSRALERLLCTVQVDGEMAGKGEERKRSNDAAGGSNKCHNYFPIEFHRYHKISSLSDAAAAAHTINTQSQLLASSAAKLFSKELPLLFPSLPVTMVAATFYPLLDYH